MKFRQKTRYIILSLLMIFWLFSLLALYQTSRMTSPFPSASNTGLIVISWLSTALFAVSSFTIGLDELGVIDRIRKTLHKSETGENEILVYFVTD